MYSASLFKTIFALSILLSCTIAQTSFPLGIHLGPKYITASTTHPNGTISNIASIKGSTAYQFILAPPTTSNPPNPALIPKTLRTTFAGVKSSSDIALGSKIRDVVITVPNHVGEDIREGIMRAAGLAGYEVLDSMRFTEAVGWAYGFLGGGVREEEDGDGRSVIVMVEYNESGLDVWVMDESWGVKPKGHILFPESGVEAIIDEAADTYFRTVHRRLESTLRKFLVQEDGSVVAGLRGVVLVGDASEKAMGEMRVVLERVLTGLGYGDLIGKGVVRDEVEGLYVGSVGAARRGREMVVERERRGHEEL